jgi:hypothetical protein
VNKPREIRRELARLRRQYRWELAHGFIREPGTGMDLYQMCSWTAAIFTWEFNGQQIGYTHGREHGGPANDSAVIVAKGLGHDFCIINGRWLVDFWAWRVFHERDLYDLQNPRDNAIVDHLYGDRSTWRDTHDRYMNWCGHDVVGEYLGCIRRVGYPLKGDQLALDRRIASAHELRESRRRRACAAFEFAVRRGQLRSRTPVLSLVRTGPTGPFSC